MNATAKLVKGYLIPALLASVQNRQNYDPLSVHACACLYTPAHMPVHACACVCKPDFDL